MGLVAIRVTTSMTAWSVQPSLSALRLCAMEPAVVTSIPMSCKPPHAAPSKNHIGDDTIFAVLTSSAKGWRKLPKAVTLALEG